MKIIKKLISLLLVLFILSGCGQVREFVSYTVYPIGYLINRIGGDRVSAVSIQNNNMVQLANVNDTFDTVLKNSIYLFHIGDLEPYIEIYEDEIDKSGAQEIDLSTLNGIYLFKRYTLVYMDGKENYIEGPYYSGSCFDEIDINTIDLNLWLDPILMLSMANDVRDTLSSNFVENSSYFNNNYKKLENDLITLDAAYQELATRLKKENKTIKFASISASFGNWQKAYGFQVYPVCLSKYGTLPSEEQLAIIKQRLINDNVSYIVYEPNMSEEMMNLFNSLEKELGLKRVNLNNISSLTSSQISSNKDYLSLMYENLSVLENMIVSVNDTAGD